MVILFLLLVWELETELLSLVNLKLVFNSPSPSFIFCPPPRPNIFSLLEKAVYFQGQVIKEDIKDLAFLEGITLAISTEFPSQDPAHTAALSAVIQTQGRA